MKKFFLFMTCFLFSCVSSQAVDSNSDYTDIVDSIVSTAYSLEGKNRVVVNGRTFNSDCTGVVLAVYYGAGIDLGKYFSQYTGNGVSRIYKLLRDRNLLYFKKMPCLGDVVFWDNTYDKNGDGLENDYLTHIGVIVSVKANGDLKYVHYHYGKGVTIENMNLFKPSTYSIIVNGKKLIINSFMRATWAPKSDKQLAGELVKSLGKAYVIE